VQQQLTVGITLRQELLMNTRIALFSVNEIEDQFRQKFVRRRG
jgi:hypothetical protein